MRMIQTDKQKKKQAGFALLMTIVILTVVVSITLSVIGLSIKQTRITANTTDSEIAFHASNAGLECVRHWRRNQSASFEAGALLPIDCLGSNNVTPNERNSYNSSHRDVSGSGSIHQYQYRITWGAGEFERCSEMTFLIFVSNLSGGNPLTMDNMSEYIAGYPNESKTCEVGGRCTVFSARGYSSACSDIDQIGTIQRDLLLEF